MPNLCLEFFLSRNENCCTVCARRRCNLLTSVIQFNVNDSLVHKQWNFVMKRCEMCKRKLFIVLYSNSCVGTTIRQSSVCSVCCEEMETHYHCRARQEALNGKQKRCIESIQFIIPRSDVDKVFSVPQFGSVCNEFSELEYSKHICGGAQRGWCVLRGFCSIKVSLLGCSWKWFHYSELVLFGWCTFNRKEGKTIENRH